MKNSIYLVMNYWPKEDYWLCSEFYKRHITYRLIGIDSKVRKLRYAKMGGGIWKILRFAHAIKVAVNTKKDEIVVVMDDTPTSVFISCTLSFLGRKNNVICLNMMDSLHPNLAKKMLYRAAFRRMYASANNQRIMELYSSLYGLPQNRFFYLPDCIANWGMKILQRKEPIECGGYIFSGGSTFRDLDLFIDVAWKLPQYRFVGIARKTGFPKKQLPNNVKMLFDVDETTFNDYLKKCSVVFMPINVKTQGGQIVIFKGGLYRKAVVTTDTAAIRTYIADGRNGLLTRFKDSQSAIQALNKVMDNDNFRNNLGNGLYDDIRQLTPTLFVDLLTDFLKKKGFKI